MLTSCSSMKLGNLSTKNTNTLIISSSITDETRFSYRKPLDSQNIIFTSTQPAAGHFTWYPSNTDQLFSFSNDILNPCSHRPVYKRRDFTKKKQARWRFDFAQPSIIESPDSTHFRGFSWKSILEVGVLSTILHRTSRIPSELWC